MKHRESLPFVCRFEGATIGKWKQDLTELGNTAEPANAKR